MQVDPVDHDAITNPRVIFEVLSRTTESYDRGKKFDLYRQLVSLLEYVVVAQDEALVEHFARQENGSWILTVFRDLTSDLELPTLSAKLPLSEIYEEVTFGPEDSELHSM